MPRAREIGIGSARCPTGPTNSVLDVRGRRARPRHGRPRRAPPPVAARRAPASPPGAGRGRLPPAAGRRRRGAERRRRVHRLPDRARVGHGRDAGLPRPRRCSSAGSTTRACEIALERARRRRRRRGDPGRRRVRRLASSTTAGGCRSTARRRAGAHDAAALASRGAAPPPEEGAVGAGHRDVVPGLQGRHRYVVAGDRRRAHRRGAAADELRRAASGSPSTACPSAGCCPAPAPRRRERRPARASAWWSRTRPSTRAGCARLARRIGLGLARTGSTAHHGSGEIFLAAAPGRGSTGTARPTRAPRLAGRGLDDLFEAVVDAAEEAVLNSLLGVADDGRPRRQHQRGARPGRSSPGCCAEAGRAGH